MNNINYYHYMLLSQLNKIQKQLTSIEKLLHPQLFSIAKKGERRRGHNCSKKGKEYEIKIHSIVSRCKIRNTQLLFNIQGQDNLGGCSSNVDLVCQWLNGKNINIEIKKKNTPDWMQCTLKYDETSGWHPSPNNRIPNLTRKIFNNLINNKIIFNGKIPPFFYKKIKYDEWKEIKDRNPEFNDCYLECENDSIKKLYQSKGIHYIQISDKGLYHLGNDICGFNVPEFICEQKVRIRTKIHSHKKEYCVLSVTMSCKPININKLISSNYSLDDPTRLPTNLEFMNC